MAAIVAAVIASTICCMGGSESALGVVCTLVSARVAFSWRLSTRVSATREGRRDTCSRRLEIRGGNDGASLSFWFAAWYIRGVTCLLEGLSRPACRCCWPESLSEVPENVARLAFPRPLEGSSRRRGLAEEELPEESVLSGATLWSWVPGESCEPNLCRPEWHRPFPKGRRGGRCPH